MEQVLLVVLGAGALLARAGQALYGTGLSRAKNAAGAVLRTICDLSVAIIAFWAVGAALLSQRHNPVVGLHREFLLGLGGFDPSLFLYATVILIATSALVGAVAERSRFYAVCGASAVLAGIAAPLAGNWVWQGWLDRLGFIDRAWAGPAHLSAGIFALVGAWCVGPRNGKYNRDGSTNMIPGHSVPLAGAGAMLIVVGWVPYVVACCIAPEVELGQVAFNVLLAAAGGSLAAMALGQMRYGKPDIMLTILGMLGGVVSITAGPFMNTPAALLTGAVAGAITPLAAVHIDLIRRIDDPAGSIAVHGVAGAWGILAAGIFTRADTFAHYFRQLGVQALGLVAIGALALVLAIVTWWVMGKTVGLRASEADEFDGLDLAEHDIGAYPDFQQNTIKSYHLREA